MRKALTIITLILAWTFNTVAFTGLIAVVATGPSLFS